MKALRDGPVYAVAGGILAFYVSFYLLGVVVVVGTDRDPAGAECIVPRGTIVMDDGDLIMGTESIDWFPVPRAACTSEEERRVLWSKYHFLVAGVAVGVGIGVGWGLHRRRKQTEIILCDAEDA